MNLIKSTLAILLWPFFLQAQTYSLELSSQGPKTSLRGLSMPNDQTAWTSGSNGYIGKMVSAKDWTWFQPKGYESLDFRDIEAFDAQNAIIMNAGAPAYILKTMDGGRSWKEVYYNADPKIFLDGMAFWDKKRGLVYGDPIAGKVPLLYTQDGGESWQQIEMPFSFPDGEAGFAASGTGITVLPGGKVWLGTGGKFSNVYYSPDYGKNWQKQQGPILQGGNSTGIFSLDFYDARLGVAVGGDYTKDQQRENNVLITRDGGQLWQKPKQQVGGYRSGVKFIDAKFIVATGTSGTDISRDGGESWETISTTSFNAVQKSKSGKRIFLSGNNGRVMELKY